MPIRTRIGPRGQSCICLSGGPESARRSREGDEEGIALRIDLDTLIGRERLTQDTAMVAEHPRVFLGAQVM
jgi:hypothetical protein